MACLEEAFHPRQHHALAVAAEIARAQSGREHLAIHARQLALEPRLQILRRHPRPLLLRLEQAHRHALEDHVHRDQRLGLPVMIIKTWYYTAPLDIPMDRIKAGTDRIFIWGWMEYDDTLKGTLGTPRHRTEFCNELVVLNLGAD